MLTDIERRRLQEQGLGELWHEQQFLVEGGPGRPILIKCSCGKSWFGKVPTKELHDEHINRTFTDAQDYEDLLIAVVRPNISRFHDYVSHQNPTYLSDLYWFLTLSIEERNKIIHDFGVEVKGWKK